MEKNQEETQFDRDLSLFEASEKSAKRSGHVALLVMGTIVVGMTAYGMMADSRCEPRSPGSATAVQGGNGSNADTAAKTDDALTTEMPTKLASNTGAGGTATADPGSNSSGSTDCVDDQTSRSSRSGYYGGSSGNSGWYSGSRYYGGGGSSGTSSSAGSSGGSSVARGGFGGSGYGFSGG